MKMTLNKRDFKDEEYWEGILDSLGVPEDQIHSIDEIDVDIELVPHSCKYSDVDWKRFTSDGHDSSVW